MNDDATPSFADFAEEDDLGGLSGTKMKIADIIGKQIVVLKYELRDSKCKAGQKFIKLQFSLNGEIHVLFTGSTVLIRLMQKYGDKAPFNATIALIDKYYTFK